MAGAAKAHKASKAVNIQDLRRMARRRLPKVVFDYVDGGAEDEISLRANEQVFSELTFRPRQAVFFPKTNLSTRVLNLDLSVPFLLAPVGYSRLMHPLG